MNKNKLNIMDIDINKKILTLNDSIEIKDIKLWFKLHRIKNWKKYKIQVKNVNIDYSFSNSRCTSTAQPVFISKTNDIITN